jgi:signal transduction histidine kinase
MTFARICSTTVALFGLIVLWLVASARADAIQQSVLILDQGGPGLRAYSQIDDAFRSHLEQPSVAIYAERLDLNVFTGPHYYEILETYIAGKYSDIPIGVIVAIGAKALQYAYSIRTHTGSMTPIVFAGVAAPAVDLATLPTKVTGRTVEASLATMVTTARALVPELKQVFLLGDPLERQSYRSHFANELASVGSDLELVNWTGLPVRVLKERLSKLPMNAAILYTTINVDGDGRLFTPREALRVLSREANRPIVVDIETFLGHGGTGGFVFHPAIVGQETAQLVSRILRGEDASKMAITPSAAITPAFDWNELQRWKVSEAQLPTGSEILFRELSAWERYRWYIVMIGIAFCLQTAFIVVLLLEHRGRRAAVARSFQLMSDLAHVDRVATAGELTASIAHEMRQPLAAIGAFGSAGMRWLSSEPPDVGEARSALQGIVDESHRADSIIKSVRSMFNKGEARTSILLSALIKRVLELVAREIQKNRIVLTLELADNPDPRVYGDEVQLQQVILNLTLNAIEAMKLTPEGERFLKVSTDVAANRDVLITIEDSGPGIDPANADKLFKPFFSTKPKGMGIGLSICRSIIAAHQGQLTNLANRKRGAAFEIRLPGAEKAAP